MHQPGVPALAAGKSSRVVDWLKALARSEHQRRGGPGVGVVGRCFTGGFALAMAVDDVVLAPVLSQPSLPFSISSKHKASIDTSPADIAVVTEAVIGKTLERAWAVGAGPGVKPLTIDIDSTIWQVEGTHKHGASYGYTKVLGYHPLLATRADTGEILRARMRKGSANTQRGAVRFIEELIARVRRAGATGQITARVDSGFWSNETLATLNRLNVRHTMARKGVGTARPSTSTCLRSSLRSSMACIPER